MSLIKKFKESSEVARAGYLLGTVACIGATILFHELQREQERTRRLEHKTDELERKLEYILNDMEK